MLFFKFSIFLILISFVVSEIISNSQFPNKERIVRRRYVKGVNHAGYNGFRRRKLQPVIENSTPNNRDSRCNILYLINKNFCFKI